MLCMQDPVHAPAADTSQILIHTSPHLRPTTATNNTLQDNSTSTPTCKPVCPPNCSACTSPTACSTCQAGFYNVSACIPSGCMLCCVALQAFHPAYTVFHAPISLAYACLMRAAPVQADGRCTPCSTTCATCTNSTSCATCKDGFYNVSVKVGLRALQGGAEARQALNTGLPNTCTRLLPPVHQLPRPPLPAPLPWLGPQQLQHGVLEPRSHHILCDLQSAWQQRHRGDHCHKCRPGELLQEVGVAGDKHPLQGLQRQLLLGGF